MTIDTACSGSLVSLDVACRYLQTREINGAIVAASNLYLSPEHNMDCECSLIMFSGPVSIERQENLQERGQSLTQ